MRWPPKVWCSPEHGLRWVVALPGQCCVLSIKSTFLTFLRPYKNNVRIYTPPRPIYTTTTHTPKMGETVGLLCWLDFRVMKMDYTDCTTTSIITTLSRMFGHFRQSFGRTEFVLVYPITNTTA
jgi:hypothetical protein